MVLIFYLFFKFSSFPKKSYFEDYLEISTFSNSFICSKFIQILTVFLIILPLFQNIRCFSLILSYMYVDIF
jgi:hypothetical protein